MKYAALDLSKTSTGWALWDDGMDRPRFGHWSLGTAYTTDGQVFAKLHQHLIELRQVHKFGILYFEEPIHPAQLSGATNIKTIRLMAGLAAHAESFAAAVRIKSHAINISTWRADFIGRQEAADERSAARERKKLTGKGSARDGLKKLTVERCRQFGIKVRGDDEADAVGILDYSLTRHEHITPPWRMESALLPQLGIRR